MIYAYTYLFIGAVLALLTARGTRVHMRRNGRLHEWDGYYNAWVVAVILTWPVAIPGLLWWGLRSRELPK